jgi:Flp pilus assembly pilin Flp
MLQAMLRIFRRGDHGQDLSEYCLLTAVIALIALGLFTFVSGGVQGMWSTAGTTLSAANAAAATPGATGQAAGR